MTANNHIAVIGFSNATSPLLPLWPTTHRAMLPVAGKPLVVHHIERLAAAGVTHIRIAGSIQQFAVRKRVGDGGEWGVTVRYSDLHGPDLRNECVITNGTCLYLLGDELSAVRANENLADVDPGAEVVADDISAPGLYQLKDNQLTARCYDSSRENSECFTNIAGPGDFLRSNTQAARGLLEGIVLPGLRIHEAAVADWHSRIDSTAYIGAGIVIGKHCFVRGTARLEENVVLSNGVIVDHGACLENVVVLPNTYVNSALRLKDAVVGPQGILATDGTFYPAKDHRLVGGTRSASEQQTGIPGRLPTPWRLDVAISG